MADETDTWAAFLSTGMALFVVGLLLLDGSEWYVQYPVFVGSLAFTVLAVRRA